MILIENTEVIGFQAAIRGMRNPLNSWGKSDSGICKGGDDGIGCEHCAHYPDAGHQCNHCMIIAFQVGAKTPAYDESSAFSQIHPLPYHIRSSLGRI